METIKYFDKVIFPDKYLLKSKCGKKFKSIDEWVEFERKKLSKYKYRRNQKYKLPYILIINISQFRDADKCLERNSIEEISNNFDTSALYFSKDLSSIVMQTFYGISGYCVYDVTIDYDFVYGNKRVDTSMVYYSNLYKCSNPLVLSKGKYMYNSDELCLHTENNIYCLYETPSNYPLYSYKNYNKIFASKLNRYMVYDKNSIECILDVKIIDSESEDKAIEVYRNRFNLDPIKVVKVPNGKWFYFEDR